MKKALLTMMVLGLTLSTLAGCSTSSSSSSTSTAATGGKQKYAIIVKNTGNPYNEKEMEGYNKAIEEIGGEVITKAPDQPTAEAQIQMINELITQKVVSIAIAANDPDALQPALKKAMAAGIKVISLDSAVNADSRMVHVNQADPNAIGRVEIETIAKMIDYKGEIAILSATSQATNQNSWIEVMKKTLQDSKYKDMKLVKVAFGDDLRDKSVSETEALLKTYPNLKGIVAPSTVAVAAAAKVLTDKGLKGKVQLTGLGLPSEMADYITSGVSTAVHLWNPMDVGYLAGYTSEALVKGTITGKAGDKFKAGTLGDKEVITVGKGTEIMLGDPFEFNASNIDQWKKVY
ncbi:MAG: rhamnose ABC transporter substrate-binding protein [Clostridiaceae bacterium]|nr:rhamnose ABC transporter substrate-binding protein [Clostridiaceae bacterium]